LNLDPNSKRPALIAPAPGLEQGSDTGIARDSSEQNGNGAVLPLPQNLSGKAPVDAQFDARQRRLLKLAEVDPAGARPGLALTRGLDAAKRWAAGEPGAETQVEAALADAAEALGGVRSSG
jgi:hypothetical protein